MNDIKITDAKSITTPIKYKKLTDIAQEPIRGSAAAAGYDLYAATNDAITIPAHETVKVGTGIAIELPYGTFGAIFARSGLATKQGLRPANCVGVVDSDYRGEVIVALHNDTNEEKVIESRERIAQLVVMPFIPVRFEEVKELSNTDRNEGGFGSTGK